MADCGMNVPCPALTESQALQKMSMRVDLIREITRNFIGAIVIPGIIYLLYKFVEMSPPDDRLNVMLLVIGYMGGLVTGISTWYFGGAMRSAVQQALTQIKGGTLNVTETEPITPVPVVAAVVASDPGVSAKTDDSSGSPKPIVPVG